MGSTREDCSNGERDLRDKDLERRNELAAGDNERASNEWIRAQKNPDGACIGSIYLCVYSLILRHKDSWLSLRFCDSSDVEMACFVLNTKLTQNKSRHTRMYSSIP
jgi:hypothetical protein